MECGERYAPIPISAISAFNLPGRLAIVLKGYYDGSGGKKDPNCRFVTLAAYSATDPTWALFEEHWQRILDELQIPYFHTIEAIAGEGPFCREKGWNSEKVVRAAIKLIASLAALPIDDFCGFSCTVEIEGHKKASKLLGSKVAPLEATCVDWCFGGLFQRLVKQDNDKLAPIEAFFDKNEPFLHWADRTWRSKNAVKRLGWPALVTTIAPVEMRQVRPIQAADIAAWAMRHFYENNRQSDSLHQTVTLSSNVVERCYGFDDLVQKYTERPWR